jgi:hypothetical protein
MLFEIRGFCTSCLNCKCSQNESFSSILSKVIQGSPMKIKCVKQTCISVNRILYQKAIDLNEICLFCFQLIVVSIDDLRSK